MIKRNNLGKQTLLFAANLSIPTFQVIIVNAELGCAHCRQRVTQVITRMSASREFAVDVVGRKQVVVKGDLRLKHMPALNNEVPMKETQNPSVFNTVPKFLINWFGLLRIRLLAWRMKGRQVKN
ncbi:hypothetical protein PHJA_002668200 [Phtheirospermum japonicum]|uniref:HMA domain-containing protein n=1 Tax=Phtheirospermum japonicum TaxID=374723 RepID=A0A830CZ81_9LAMI|nr:hypothetical protein PHJA_002668200 [Phtheirospermum japonicum]